MKAWNVVLSLWIGAIAVGPVDAQLSEVAPLPGDGEIRPLFGSQRSPRAAAAAGGTYLAVWVDDRAPLQDTVEIEPWEVRHSDIYAMRLAADGTPLDAAPVGVDTGPYGQVEPAVAASGQGWLVAYESRSISSTGTYTTQDVRAVRVSAQGQVLDPVPLAIETSDDEAYRPVVTGDASGWTVFWTDDRSILARRVDAQGNVGPLVSAHTGTQWIFDPAVAFAGDRYLVTWERTTGVYGRLFDATLAPLGPAFSISTIGRDPEVTTDGTDFFVAFAYLGYWAEIRGTVVRRDGTVVNPSGIVLDGGSFLALEPASVAWDGSRYLAYWNESRFEFPSGNIEELRFRRIDANGAPLAPPQSLLVSTASGLQSPFAASAGAGTSLLGWIDNRNSTLGHGDGFTRLVDGAGTSTSERCFTIGPATQLDADFASGPQGATLADDVRLVAFRSADANETRIVVQRVDGHGRPIDLEPIVVAGGVDTLRAPVAAWNGALWMVAWEDFRAGTNGRIHAKRVLPDGTVLDGASIDVMPGNGPAIAASSGAFLIAATEVTSGDIQALWGRRVGADGMLLDGARFFLGFDYAVAPAIGGFDDRWIVLWHRHATHDTASSTLQARFVLASGAVQPLLDPSSSTGFERFADVAVEGDVATFVWTDGTNVRVRRIAKDGTLFGAPQGVLASAGALDATAAAIGLDGSKGVVAWVDDRAQPVLEPGLGDLFGARLDGAMAPLDGGGRPLAADPRAAESEAAISGRRGVALVVYPAVLEAFGTWRVVLGAWRDWQPQGFALAGSTGEPVLEPSGLLVPGATVRLEVAGGVPGTIGIHFVGRSAIFAPLLGGTLVPAPDLLMPIVLDAQGRSSVAVGVQNPLPPGFAFFLQTWLLDAGAPQLVAATQGYSATAP